MPVRVLGYFDVTIKIFGLTIRNPLTVIEKFAYPVLIGMDILSLYAATTETGVKDAVRLTLDSCPVCGEEHLLLAPQREIVAAVASTLSDTTLPLNAARSVQVSLPPKVLCDAHFLVEPLPHELVTAACAALLSVCEVTGATHVQSIVNMSDKPVNLCDGTPIAAVFSVMPQHPTAASNSAVIQRLPTIRKLVKFSTTSILIQSSSMPPLN